MRRSVLLLALMLCAVLLASGLALAQTAPGAAEPPPAGSLEGGEVVLGEYIVVLEDKGEEPPKVAESDETEHPGLEVERVYGEALEGYAAEIPQGEVDDVENDPGVLFVAPNRRYERAAEQVVPTGVDRVEADKSSTVAGNGSGTVKAGVAVIDDGIDAGHPDLNVMGGKDCNPADSADDYHGTAVAGLAAGKDNDFGVVGVAPGAALYDLDVFNEKNYATDAAVICAVDWVTANAGKIDVANMSLGGRGSDDGRCGVRNRDALHYAVCRSVKKDVTYVVAAGNSGENLENETPAAYDEVITATAMTDHDGKPGRRPFEQGDPDRCPSPYYTYPDEGFAFFSNYAAFGSPDARHTISAPGVCLQTTLPGNQYDEAVSGTSFSAPIVAGAAALYKSRHPNTSPERVLERLRAEAREQPRSYGYFGDPHLKKPFKNRYYGYLLYAGDL